MPLDSVRLYSWSTNSLFCVTQNLSVREWESRVRAPVLHQKSSPSFPPGSPSSSWAPTRRSVLPALPAGNSSHAQPFIFRVRPVRLCERNGMKENSRTPFFLLLLLFLFSFLILVLWKETQNSLFLPISCSCFIDNNEVLSRRMNGRLYFQYRDWQINLLPF